MREQTALLQLCIFAYLMAGYLVNPSRQDFRTLRPYRSEERRVLRDNDPLAAATDTDVKTVQAKTSCE